MNDQNEIQSFLDAMSEDTLYRLASLFRAQVRRVAKSGGSLVELKELRRLLVMVEAAHHEKLAQIESGIPF